MICGLCNNLLKIEKINNNIQYVCTYCGNSYPLTNNYTLIFESSSVETVLDKKGTDIYYLPCNPREFKQCPGCPEKIVAYERIPKVFTKVYGCKCGKMWYEKMEFGGSGVGSVADGVAVNTTKNKVDGGDMKDEKKASGKVSISELLKHSR